MSQSPNSVLPRSDGEHTNRMQEANENKTSAPIIIIGGGPVGLTCSILLSIRKIPHLLFERHATTSIHPKACGINQRTTEIFRIMGIEDEVYAHAAPPEIAGRTAWYTSLGEEGREIHSRDAWGGGEYRKEYETFSPSRYCILPQVRLEPILKRRALELNSRGLYFNHEVIAASNEDVAARVTIRNRESNETWTASGSYVVVADGGRMFTSLLGISWNGEADIYSMVTAHVKAPIRHLHPDPRNFMTWFTNPEMGGSTRTGYLYQIGPWPEALENPELEEWVFACGKTESDPGIFDAESIMQRFKKTIGIPDLKAEMLSFSHWSVNALYAAQYRLGRIFLVGDSAHRIPPWGALGMNSGISDVQNLVWKLSLALKHPQMYDRLLDTYERERQPIGKNVGASSLANMRRHVGHIDKALGISTNQSPEENVRAAAPFFDLSHPSHAQMREAVQEGSMQLDSEFKAPGYEVGWFYASADIDGEGGPTHGGQTYPDASLIYHTYHPSTIPGHHLPHAWVEKNGNRVALRDLLHLLKFTLFTGGYASCTEGDADRTIVVAVGERGWQDITGTWKKVRGVDETGGVLVRPDGIVAWRGALHAHDQQSWKHIVDRVLKLT